VSLLALHLLNVVLVSKTKQRKFDRNLPENKQPQPSYFTLPPRNSSFETAGFVHIGKTGGSTISSLLRTGCNSFLMTDDFDKCRRNFTITEESPVSKLVEHYYHVPDFWRLPESNHKIFIVTCRDVYDRTVSALLYHHPENAKYYRLHQTPRQKQLGKLAYQCFPTLQDFAKLIKQHERKSIDMDDCQYPFPHNVIEPNDCVALACASLQGKIRFFTHLFFNYRNILDTKLPKRKSWKPEIYVLRQEHLWDDWRHLNQLLVTSGNTSKEEDNYSFTMSSQEGGPHQPVESHRNITGLQLPVTRNVSDQGRLALCKALEKEYNAYFRLLLQANNMNVADIIKCQHTATQNCPNLEISNMIDLIRGEL
jgi:hypothetical protein